MFRHMQHPQGRVLPVLMVCLELAAPIPEGNVFIPHIMFLSWGGDDVELASAMLPLIHDYEV